MAKEIRRKETTVLDILSKKLPLGFSQTFPLAKLMDDGITRMDNASVVELEGEICAVIPGSDRSYKATKAVVSWNTPMDINALILEGKQDGDLVTMNAGRLDFRGRRHSQARVAAGYDPNITLYREDGSKVEINQALGVLRLYVMDCKIRYKR